MEDFDAIASMVQQTSSATQVTTDKKLRHRLAIDGVEPQLVITPGSVEEMAHVLQLLANYPLTVLVCGGGTQINVGGLPEHIDVMLKTVELNRILEHEAPDLTCQVEAGITLEALQRQLALQRQHLAIDPPDAAQSTIGGILAANSSGPKRYRYGTARDLVIGLRVLQASGEIGRSGGRVVKNVAGYDLNKLYIGSFGTLGIILEANFKLHPLPEVERTLLLRYTNSADLVQTVIALTNSPLTPSAIELLNVDVDMLLKQAYDQAHEKNYTLAVDFEGSTIPVTRQIDETLKLAHQHHATNEAVLEGHEQDLFWQTVRELTRGTVTCKVSILVSQQAAFLQEIERVSHEQGLTVTVVAHAGNGILYIELPADQQMTHMLNAISTLRQCADEMKGFLVVERCPTEIKQRLNVWGETGASFHLMQRLKQQFDPRGLFVRGRFVGGL